MQKWWHFQKRSANIRELEGKGEGRGGNVEEDFRNGFDSTYQYAYSIVDETGKQRKVRTLRQRVS